MQHCTLYAMLMLLTFCIRTLLSLHFISYVNLLCTLLPTTPHPLPPFPAPYFLERDNRPLSAFGSRPWIIWSFLVFLSHFHSSTCQLLIPKLYFHTCTATDPIAPILFHALNSLSTINLSLFKYSFFSFSFSFLCSIL
jgi:hypothetical protein